jgi:hypothetical protein
MSTKKLDANDWFLLNAKLTYPQFTVVWLNHYGYQLPKFVFTDNVDGDQAFLENEIPSLEENVQHINKRGREEQVNDDPVAYCDGKVQVSELSSINNNSNNQTYSTNEDVKVIVLQTSSDINEDQLISIIYKVISLKVIANFLLGKFSSKKHGVSLIET